MAREYIRPDLGSQMLSELVPESTRLLINPSWRDLSSALALLQCRTRRNRLPLERLRQLFENSQQPEFFSATVLSAESAPPSYRYDYPSTQAAACRLGDGLTGFLLTRAHTPPGDIISPALYPGRPEDSDFDPEAWRDSVCLAFWTMLTDAEIDAVERKAIEYALVIDARRREEARQRERHVRTRRRERIAEAAKRTQTQLDLLFKGVRPSYTTHLSEACRQIAGVVSNEGRESVPWHEFKKRWPSVAERYRNDLLPAVNNGSISVSSLLGMEGLRMFSLSFGLWTGPQRVFQAPQIVFRVDARNLLSGLAKSDASLRDVIELVRRLNRASIRFHPTLEWTVGWLRVHVDDDNRMVFVDEIQSDTLERLRQLTHTHSVTHEIECVLRPWNLHGFASICHWASTIHYAVGAHSERSRDHKAGMTKSSRKWNLYYESVIKLFGLREDSVPGYPAPVMTNRHEIGVEKREMPDE